MGAGGAAVAEGVRLATVWMPALDGDRGDQSPAVDRRQQRHLPGRVGDRAAPRHRCGELVDSGGARATTASMT